MEGTITEKMEKDYTTIVDAELPATLALAKVWTTSSYAF